jgi:hypothetical protein
MPTVEKFPRSHKFTIGDRIEITALDVLEALVAVHESLVGTKCECRLVLVMAASRGEAADNGALR